MCANNTQDQDREQECTLYLAPSTIPGDNAGLGMFSSVAYAKDAPLHNAVAADILVPYEELNHYQYVFVDDEKGHYDDDNHLLMKSYNWVGSDQHPLTQHPDLMMDNGGELIDMSDSLTGFGAIVNHDYSRRNTKQCLIPSFDQYARPHVGVDAQTPFHHLQVFAGGHDDVSMGGIKAGAELFLDYGAAYFEDGDDNDNDAMSGIPVKESFEEAAQIMEGFRRVFRNMAPIRIPSRTTTTNNNCHDHNSGRDCAEQLEQAQTQGDCKNTEAEPEMTRAIDIHITDHQLVYQDLWNTVRLSTSNKRTRAVLPTNVDEVLIPPHNTDIKGERENDGEALHTSDSSIRSKEWLEENGMCLDRLYVGPSTISFEAGRGAFAKSFLQSGQVIAPCPVLQLDRFSRVPLMAEIEKMDDGIEAEEDELLNLVKKVKITEWQDKLKHNYCFGHALSSVLLCPYVTTTALLNHSPDNYNAEIRIASTSNNNRNAAFNNNIKSILKQRPRTLLRQKTAFGVVFEIVALRDIAPDEEILINYGAAWQEAWDQHVAKWKPSYYSDVDFTTPLLSPECQQLSLSMVGDDDISAESYPQCLQDAVAPLVTTTAKEQRRRGRTSAEVSSSMGDETPFANAPTSPATACFFYYETDELDSNKHNNKSTSSAAFPVQLPKSKKHVLIQQRTWKHALKDGQGILGKASTNGKGTLGGLFPCWILAQEKEKENPFNDKDDPITAYTYMVLVHVELYNTMNADMDDATRSSHYVLVRHVPLRAIQNVTPKWMALSHVDHRPSSASSSSGQKSDNGPTPPKPFRHPIYLPDDVFPDAWKDLA
jgi:hypothetical protein